MKAATPARGVGRGGPELGESESEQPSRQNDRAGQAVLENASRALSRASPRGFPRPFARPQVAPEHSRRFTSGKVFEKALHAPSRAVPRALKSPSGLPLRPFALFAAHPRAFLPFTPFRALSRSPSGRALRLALLMRRLLAAHPRAGPAHAPGLRGRPDFRPAGQYFGRPAGIGIAGRPAGLSQPGSAGTGWAQPGPAGRPGSMGTAP